MDRIHSLLIPKGRRPQLTGGFMELQLYLVVLLGVVGVGPGKSPSLLLDAYGKADM